MTTIYEALSAVMRETGAVKKSDQNTAQNFSFRGVDAVTSAVYPALVNNGVVVAPEVLDYQYGTVVVGRNRTEMGHVRLRVQFTFYGPDGDSVVSVVAAESMDAGDKATAKAHSVAFRTALLQTLCLPTDEPDPDSHTYERAGVDPADEARQALLTKCNTVWGVDPREIAKRFHDEYGFSIDTAPQESIVEFTTKLEAEYAGPA